MPNIMLTIKRICFCTVLLTAFVPRIFAWEVEDKIPLERVKEIVKAFLSVPEGEEKSLEKQKLCCYVIKQVCTSESDPDQDVVSKIFLEALRPSQLLTGQRGVLESFKHMIETTTWTIKEIEACKKLYKKTPQELTEMPMLTVEASELATYIPDASVIWGLRIENADNGTLKLLGQFTNLKALNLYHANISDSGLQDLPRSLTALSLGGCQNLTDAGLNTIAAQCPNLTKIDLSGCENITGTGLNMIAAQCPNLTKIYLWNCPNISDAALKGLPEGLTALSLNGCKNITDAGIKDLPKNLATLDLSFCKNITDSGLQSLPRNLTTLYLNACSITDAGLQYLPMNLTTLGLSGCKKITDAGIQYLPRSLVTLDLSASDITNASFQYLPTSLTKLDLSHCIEINYSSIEELRKARPHLKVLR